MNAVSTHADRMIRTLAGLGFQLATPRDIVAGRAAAAALVGGEIASAEVMLRVQARSRCAVFIARGRGRRAGRRRIGRPPRGRLR